MRCGNKPRTAKQRAIIQNSEREKKKNPNILNPIQREINSKILRKKTQKTQAIGAKKKKKNY
jgi:hypothetical protein